MSDKQRRALKESLSEFGEILPVIVRAVGDKYQIVDGQHRFEELEGQAEINCVVIDATDTEAMRLTQILNRTRGEDDPERLADLFATLSDKMSVEELIKGMPIDSEDEFNDLLEGLRAELPEEDMPDDSDWGDALGKLPEGDRQPYQGMNFTLHDKQVEVVKEALSLAKSLGDFDSENENSNGNALARICETYLTDYGNS